MFGLETIRDALVNFSAGTPSGQAYLANQREQAQQAQLFPLQLEMARLQASKAQQEIKTQEMKSQALARIFNNISGGGGQQQLQQNAQMMSPQEILSLAMVDPSMGGAVTNVFDLLRKDAEAAVGKAPVYTIDQTTGNKVMVQPAVPGIQSFFNYNNNGSLAPAPTGIGQVAQALGNIQPAPPVSSQPATPLPSPTPQSNRQVIRNSIDEFGAQAALNAGGAQNVPPPDINGLNVPPTSTPPTDGIITPDTGGVLPVAKIPDASLPTATVVGTGTAPITPNTAQLMQENQAKEPSIYYQNALEALSKWKDKNPYESTSITNANTLLDLAVTTPTGGTESFVGPLRSIAADLGISDAVKGATGQQTFNAITTSLALPEIRLLAPATDTDLNRLKGTFGSINNTTAANVALAAMAAERARFLGALTKAKEAYVNTIGDLNMPREQRPSEQQFLKNWFEKNYQKNPALGALTDLIINGKDIIIADGIKETGWKPFISAADKRSVKERFALPIDMLKAQDE